MIEAYLVIFVVTDQFYRIIALICTRLKFEAYIFQFIKLINTYLIDMD